jgi:hypothetical protein
MNLDGNQSSIRGAIDAGPLAGAVTLVWRAGWQASAVIIG